MILIDIKEGLSTLSLSNAASLVWDFFLKLGFFADLSLNITLIFWGDGREGMGGGGRSASFCVLMSLRRRVHATCPSPLISKNVRNLLADIS